MEDIDLILAKIRQVWKENPELRLGQLFCNTANYGALYYSSNEEIIRLLEQFYNIDLSHPKPLEQSAKTKKQYKRKLPDNNGRIYIHNSDGMVKAVFKDDLDDYLNSGWRLGRKDVI